MRIAIYGVGGVGGYFGGRLALVGHDVTFIARGAHLQAMQTQGLQVTSIDGDFTIHPTHAVEDPAQIGTVDLVLVAVKAWQVPEIAPLLTPLIGPETLVLPLQNGVEAPTQLATVLGKTHVLAGLARIISFISAPGQIEHAAYPPYIALGELDNQRTERVQRLQQILHEAGINAEIPADILAALWEKFLFISAFSGVSAVTRAPVGIIRAQAPTRALLETAMHEVHAVAIAQRVNLPITAIENALAALDASPTSTTPSMQRDILAGRPSELEAQQGAVVRLGQATNVPTPINAMLYAALLPQELRARGSIAF